MQHPERPLLALSSRVAAMAALATMFAGVKYAGQQGIAVPEIMFWRQFIPAVAIIGWLAARGELGTLRTPRIRRHGVRSILGMSGMLCSFTAAILLPLAEATTLGFTTPLFAVMLTALFLHERIGAWRWGAVVLGFVGVLVIAQPGGGPINPLGMAAGLMSGLILAVISFLIRDLLKTDPTVTVVFYFSAFGALMTAIFLPFYATAHTPFEWLILIGVGLLGTIGQLFVSASLRNGTVATVIVMDYTSLIWATLLGFLIWDRLPPVATWLGAPAIIVAGIVIVWREQRKARLIVPAAAIAND